MERVIEPEWLDELPTADVRAIDSRSDLRRLNWFMGNARTIARVLRTIPKPARVLDVGAGDGEISAILAKRLGWRGTEFLLVDRSDTISDRTRAAFSAAHCTGTFRCCDVVTGLNEMESADVAFANLFLHHFNGKELIRVLRDIAQRCKFFVACEPRRSPFALFGSRCVALLGCNAVTRHDAVVSVRAGFDGSELSRLWPQPEQWSFSERAAGLFTHLFVARRL